MRLAAKRLGKLSPFLVADAEKRLKRFRKKLQAPVKWDPAKWEKLSEEIAELAAKVPEAGSTLSNSPVADY